ncbi:MAG: YbaK/EbsC family protein [Actinomycetota bacterium]
MALVEQLPAEVHLKERHIRFEVALHRSVHTAKSEANALGLPVAYVLKVVMLRLEDAYAMAVVPASRRIDMNLVTGVIPEGVRLATEDEIASRFPGFELGALPPLPGLLGVRAFVDPAVFDHHEVAFADGRQTESIIASPRELFWGQDVLVAPISRKPEVWGPWELEGDAIDLG